MLKPPKFLHSALIIGFLSLPFGVAAQEADVSVVLVHGAFSNSSAWNKVIPILQNAGIEVSAAQLPLSSLKSDAAAVSRLIDLQKKPVVLVGHSYGGTSSHKLVPTTKSKRWSMWLHLRSNQDRAFQAY